MEDMKSQIEEALIKSGERDRLKQLLREKLERSGWRDELRRQCKQLISQQSGVENVSVEDLVRELTPNARRSVSDTIKKELLFKIREFINESPDIN